MADTEELPTELEDQCNECHRALAGIEKLLKPLISKNRTHIEDKVRLHLMHTSVTRMHYL